jgi:serine/threonine-protein kinase
MPRRKRKTTTDAARLIGARYRLGERIGRGGMATVYRAQDEQLDRGVALKMMRADLGEDPLFVQRFEAEARRAASVSHPNVVPVYDVGVDEAPYMVMELIEGGDLAKVLATGPLPAERAARLAADAAAALQAAHDAGLVHRDVKPGNILLRTDGEAVVADFGIARATGEDSMTKTGAMLGSVEYFSPEQARGERAGPASDIYALGVVLYELLTGRRPFSGDTPFAVATARLRSGPPDPRVVVADLPPALGEIVTRAMARDPARRFPSAEAMRTALVSWLDAADAPTTTVPAPTAPPEPTGAGSETAVSVPVPASTPPRRAAAERQLPRRRRRVAAWPFALILLALIAAGYVGGRLLDRNETALPGVIVGSPEGGVLPDPTATPTPVATPSPTATPTPAPTTTPAPDPTPAPTTVPPPAPEPTNAPPAPTDAPVALAAPDDTVAAFYSDVVAGRFDDAYALWSDRMKATYARQENLDNRFDETADITFDALYVAEQSASAATVQANFLETYDSGDSRRFIGYWRLVRVDGRWLLDAPTY